MEEAPALWETGASRTLERPGVEGTTSTPGSYYKVAAPNVSSTRGLTLVLILFPLGLEY
jgi:hypothetical protein